MKLTIDLSDLSRHIAFSLGQGQRAWRSLRMRQRRAGMMGVCAWSLGKEDSLDASLNNLRNACSEADAWRANPVTAGSLSLRMVSAHCHCKRRCQRRRISTEVQ